MKKSMKKKKKIAKKEAINLLKNSPLHKDVVVDESEDGAGINTKIEKILDDNENLMKEKKRSENDKNKTKWPWIER